MRKTILFIILFFASVLNADFLGEYDIDDYIVLSVTTHRFSTGAAYTTANAQYRIYGEAAGAVSTTEIKAATDMTEDFDGVTGLHISVLQLTTANSFVAGHTYLVVYTATVDSVAAIARDTFRIRTAPLATSSAQTTAQNDLDIITGAAGVVIADDSITAAKIATGAIGADEIAAGAITSSEIAANAITVAAIADDAITAAKIAADAIGSSELATTAADEIADEVWDEGTSLHTSPGTFGLELVTVYDDWADGGRLDLLIDAIKAYWDSLTITAGYLEVDLKNLDGTAVKSTNGNIHAYPAGL